MKRADLELLLLVLAGVGTGVTARAAAGASPRAARAAAKRLRERGLVRRVDGVLTLQRDAVALLLKRASEMHDLGVILRGSNELVFCSLAEPGTVTDIVGRTGLSVPTVYRAARDLYSVGAARNMGGTIHLDGSLVDLAKAMKAVSEPDIHAHTIYRDSRRVLVRVPAGAACSGQLTAFSRFGEFGVEYGGMRDYYIVQEDVVDIHDVLVHALLAAAEHGDISGMSMVVVFYLKHRDMMDITRVRRTASRFGAAGIWLDVESYVRNRAAIKNAETFAPWGEFIEKANLYGVDPAEYTTLPPTEALLRDLGAGLEGPVGIYLLGGENMRLKGLKESTKDCDMVVKGHTDFAAVVKALAKMGYSAIAPAEHAVDDGRLHPVDILEHPTLPRVDIFTKTVMGGITLTDSMADSADHMEFGNLRVGVLRNEHVFMLKAVAGREGDIQDMAALVRGASGQPDGYNHGEFNWKMVLDEARLQGDNPGVDLPGALLDGLSYMEEQTGIRSPILAVVRRRAVDSNIMRLVRGGWRPLRDVVDSLAGGDIPHSYVLNRANSLTKSGALKRAEGRRALVCGDARFPRPGWNVDGWGMERYMAWRFHLGERPGPQGMAELAEYVRGQGCATMGDLDGAVSSGVFCIPHDPSPTPAEAVRMCLRMRG
ncbi:MAG: hypothetical protein J4G04_00050 [Nitrosopumilaceae archaeon]|nr:hypothetical protein [Nitrosopumilaceae archaeon]